MGFREPLSRRELLRGGKRQHGRHICPPGVTLSDLAGCTGCGECAAVCPSGIIRMSDGLPSVDFSRGECTFCGKCAQACPEPVFRNGVVSRFDHVATIGEGCLPFMGVDCQACRDACPVEAIRFIPRKGGPFVPRLNDDICTGCGACISVCPVNVLHINERPVEVQYV